MQDVSLNENDSWSTCNALIFFSYDVHRMVASGEQQVQSWMKKPFWLYCTESLYMVGVSDFVNNVSGAHVPYNCVQGCVCVCVREKVLLLSHHGLAWPNFPFLHSFISFKWTYKVYYHIIIYKWNWKSAKESFTRRQKCDEKIIPNI